MRKRVRKKRHIGEFRQDGFSISCDFCRSLTAVEFDYFIDSFLTNAIEAHGLLFAGGGSRGGRWSGIVFRDHRYASVSDADKAKVREWLDGYSEIQSVALSDLWDIWHGEDPFETREPNQSLLPTPGSPGFEVARSRPAWQS